MGFVAVSFHRTCHSRTAVVTLEEDGVMEAGFVDFVLNVTQIHIHFFVRPCPVICLFALNWINSALMADVLIQMVHTGVSATLAFSMTEMGIVLISMNVISQGCVSMDDVSIWMGPSGVCVT